MSVCLCTFMYTSVHLSLHISTCPSATINHIEFIPTHTPGSPAALAIVCRSCRVSARRHAGWDRVGVVVAAGRSGGHGDGGGDVRDFAASAMTVWPRRTDPLSVLSHGSAYFRWGS